MKRIFCLLLLCVISFHGFTRQYPTVGKIIRLDPKLNELIAPDAKIEVLGEGFQWTEGPLWLAAEKKLIFSDIFQNSIFEWSEAEGVQLFLKPSGYTGKQERGGELGSNALLLNPEGKLVICQHGDRRVAEMLSPITSPESKFETLAGSYEGEKLNSPNDVALSKTGELYFTDPPYGLEKNMDDPKKELSFQGVYNVSKNGRIRLLTKELSRPNGLAFSPDGTKLYVANSDSTRAIWMAFDVKSDGTLTDGKVFKDVTEQAKHEAGLPDGMKVHPNGTIFATGPGGIFIFSPEGKTLGKIVTGQKTSNCAFNEDYSTLFITADHYIMCLKLKN